MELSEILYLELIKNSIEKLEEFFKNVGLHQSQFKYDKYNSLCFQFMYKELSVSEGYPSRQTFFEAIPELKMVCDGCWKYFLNKRNESIKGYDIQLGKILEESFIEYMKAKGVNIIRADLKNRRYPDLLILDSSKAIIGYIELKYHASPFVWTFKKRPGRECYEGSITLDKEKIIKQLKIIYSELDRPVYFVHWLDFPCIKGIYFQTSEQLHDYILNNTDNYKREERVGDFKTKADGEVKKIGYLEKIYPSITEMGNFENLLNILKK